MGTWIRLSVVTVTGLWLSMATAAQTPKAIAAFQGYVNVGNGISLYARVMPGNPSAPIIVLLNGLTQDMDHWNTDVPYLQQQGATIVNIDLALQGRAMEKTLHANFAVTRPVLPPLGISGGLWNQAPTFPATSVQQQGNYVAMLLTKLGITQPVVIAGLSYGGGLALQMAADHPSQISMAILAAPYVFPLPTEDSEIQFLVSYTRQMYPQFDYISDDDLYDIILRGLTVTTYYQVEPEILKWSPPFESMAVSELVRGIRHMQYSSLLPQVKVPLHIIIAGNDQYIPISGLQTFWGAVPSAIKGSSIVIQNSEHKMNEAVGPFFAAWIWQLASNQTYITNPGAFTGQPAQGLVTENNGPRTVNMPVTIPVETYVNPENSPWKVIRDNPGEYWTGIYDSGNPNPATLNPGPNPVQ